MGKDGWTTIGLPDELYATVKTLVPGKATSVSEYVRFWVGVGVRLDEASKAAPELAKIIQKLAETLEEDS